MLKHIFSYFDKSSTFISGVLAIGIYFVLLLTLLFYFNTRQAIKPVHYVKKNEDKIRISIASAPTKEKVQTPSEQPAIPKVPIPPKVVKTKPQKKETVKKQKDTSKKVIKEKVVKKKPKKKEEEKPKPSPKPKKVNKPKSLFENIKTNKPKEKPKKQEKPKPTEKPKKKSASEMLSESMKIQKQSDRGNENAYFALIEEKLKGWPAQSEYAGETVEIRINVENTGKFTFKILRHSSNVGFNNSLKAYLKQLQSIGLGRHKRNRAYVIDVEFEARE